MENPETQYCYLNSSTSDKLFNTFVSKRTDDSDHIEFIIEKQVGETDSEQVYEPQTKHDGKLDDRVSESKQQQRGGGNDRLQHESRKSRLQSQLERTIPRFIVAKSKKSCTAKRDAETTLKKESSTNQFQSRVS